MERSSMRVHQNWRWNYNAPVADWIGTTVTSHIGLGFDTCGPSEVEGFDDFRPHASGTRPPVHVNCLYRKDDPLCGA
jgi:hypothetical protein